MQTLNCPLVSWFFYSLLFEKVYFFSNLRIKKPETFVSGFTLDVVPPGIEPGTHGFSVRFLGGANIIGNLILPKEI